MSKCPGHLGHFDVKFAPVRRVFLSLPSQALIPLQPPQTPILRVLSSPAYFSSPVLTQQPIHAALSDTGRVRAQNEDSCVINASAGVYVICDGMGGAAAGEVASHLAADTFQDFLANPRTPSGSRPMTLPDAPSNNPHHNPQTRIHAAILAANRAVRNYADTAQELTGMGTTLIALVYTAAQFRERRAVPRPGGNSRSVPPTLFLANVGDSRCYRVRDGTLLQLSEDHSFVEEQLRAGRITAEEAVASPMRNFLTRAIGAHEHVEPDIQSYRPEPQDLYLLASDGLTRELTDSEIQEILCRLIPVEHPSTIHLEIAAQALVDAANARGGRDNVTVLLLAFPPSK